MFYKHFASKNQLPGLSISRKLVKNWLILVSALLRDSIFLVLLQIFTYVDLHLLSVDCIKYIRIKTFSGSVFSCIWTEYGQLL